MYDVIDESTVVLEWLDTTLAELDYKPDMHTYRLIKTVLKAALNSCAVLKDLKKVNTGAVPSLEGLTPADQPRLQIRQYPAFGH